MACKEEHDHFGDDLFIRLEAVVRSNQLNERVCIGLVRVLSSCAVRKGFSSCEGNLSLYIYNLLSSPYGTPPIPFVQTAATPCSLSGLPGLRG